MECNKLQNLWNELFFIITKSDPSFMHLDIFDKFLYILSSENDACTIAKFIYKMSKLCCSFFFISHLTCLLSLLFSLPQTTVTHKSWNMAEHFNACHLNDWLINWLSDWLIDWLIDGYSIVCMSLHCPVCTEAIRNQPRKRLTSHDTTAMLLYSILPFFWEYAYRIDTEREYP